MRSTFYGLEIAKSALFASRTAMDVAGHNLANADTVGYTRQRLNVSAISPAVGKTLISDASTKNTSGRGVNMNYIEQVRDIFLDKQYRNENANTGYANTLADQFSWVTSIFSNEIAGEKTSSLFQGLSNFEKALNELLGDGSSNVSLRTNVKQMALSLIETSQYYYDKLSAQYNDMDANLKNNVDRVNVIAAELGEINRMIYEFELLGAQANDLKDTRNLLLDELSGYADIEYSDLEGNNFTVWIGGKDPANPATNLLVQGSHTVNELAVAATKPREIPELSNDPALNLKEVYWAADIDPNTGMPNAGVTPFDTGNGSIKATLDMRDGDNADNMGIVYIVGQMNDWVRRIVSDINAVHCKGFTMPGKDGLTESHTGEFFFTMYAADGTEIRTGAADTATAAANLARINITNFKVNQNIIDDVNNIACSSDKVLKRDDDNTMTGNDEIMKEIVALFNQSKDGLPNNFNSILTAAVADISSRGERLNSLSSAQTLRQSHLEDKRMSVASVSQDEELADIIRFNKAFSAASRLITTMDEQLDLIINKMGLVGR